MNIASTAFQVVQLIAVVLGLAVPLLVFNLVKDDDQKAVAIATFIFAAVVTALFFLLPGEKGIFGAAFTVSAIAVVLFTFGMIPRLRSILISRYWISMFLTGYFAAYCVSAGDIFFS